MTLIRVMAVIKVMGAFFSKIPKCTKVTLIIVMGAARPVAGLKKAEIRHGPPVSRKRKFAELTGIWVWARVHKKAEIQPHTPASSAAITLIGDSTVHPLTVDSVLQ